MLPDLSREMLAASTSMTMAGMRRLFAMGADRRFVARLYGDGLLGVGQVTLARGVWQPAGPNRCLLIGVCQDGELVDVVALSSSQRDQWALRTGVGWALGAEAIEDVHRVLACAAEEKPRRMRLRLHATPFDWLAAGGDGVCVLDWCAASLMELRALGERVTLQVPPGGAERIRDLLAYGCLPNVIEASDELPRGIAA